MKAGEDLQVDNGNVGLDNGNVGLDNGNVGLDNGNVALDNGNVGLDNGNVGHMLTTNQTPHIQTMEENNENVNLGKGS